MQIKGLIDDIWEKLTPDGRNNLRDHDKPLKSGEVIPESKFDTYKSPLILSIKEEGVLV